MFSEQYVNLSFFQEQYLSTHLRGSALYLGREDGKSCSTKDWIAEVIDLTRLRVGIIIEAFIMLPYSLFRVQMYFTA